MRILNFEEAKNEEHAIIDAMRRGRIFVYPTDTIYGIGCNALDSKAVSKIRKLKDRAINPFSVIAPSADWIQKNCELNKESGQWLSKLPGPYTLILRLKNKNAVAKEVNPGIETIGIRMPKHWISSIVSKANVPFVTTSVNKSGEDYMTCLEDLNDDIKGGVDFILYEGKKEGRPSKIIDLTGKAKSKER